MADVVGRLLADGVVSEGRAASGGRGRPAQLLRRADPEGLLLGLDFGHNHLSVGIGAPDVLQIPSLLGNGEVSEPGAELNELFGIPVTTLNDTVVGAFGEQQRGAAQGCPHFLFVKASHGVGAAVVIEGRLYRGSTGLAGEIGHTRFEGATAHCRCGNLACLETVAGIDGLVAELPAPYDRSSLLSPSTGDPVVDRVVADAGRAVGSVLAPPPWACAPSSSAPSSSPAARPSPDPHSPLSDRTPHLAQPDGSPCPTGRLTVPDRTPHLVRPDGGSAPPGIASPSPTLPPTWRPQRTAYPCPSSTWSPAPRG